jgi:hypothetical protein
MNTTFRLSLFGVLFLYAYAAQAQLSGSGDRFLVTGENLLKGAPDGSFGAQGIVTGDLDCDGRDDLVVQQPFSSVNAGGNQISGGVVTLVPSGGQNGPQSQQSFEWHQAVAGVPGAVEAGDAFGFSAAVFDINGDGCDDLFVGVPGEDIGDASNAGAVYGFLGDPVDVVATDVTGILNGTADDESTGTGLVGQGGPFGRLFVARSGRNATGPIARVGTITSHRFLASASQFLDDDDLLQDIRNLVGNPIAANDRWGSEMIGIPGVVALRGNGSAEVSLISGLGSLEQRRHRMASSHVAMAFGDFNGDGAQEFVQQTGSNTLAVFRRQSNGSYAASQAIPSGLVPGIEFTFINDIATGDFNRDGFDDLAIGYPGIPELTPTSGNVLVLRGSGSGLVTGSVQRLRQGADGLLDASEDRDQFGMSLAAGDFNGDGTDDLAVGVPGEKVLTETRGGIHLILGSAPVQLFANGFE